MKNEPQVSLDEIARHMGVSRDSVYRAIENRGLPAHKIGRLWKTCPPQPCAEADSRYPKWTPWVRAGNAADDDRDH